MCSQLECGVVSVVFLDDLRDLEVTTRDCTNCGEPITLPAVHWECARPLLLHTACARSIGVHLIADSREAELASGVPHWTRRAVRATRGALLVQEFEGAV